MAKRRAVLQPSDAALNAATSPLRPASAPPASAAWTASVPRLSLAEWLTVERLLWGAVIALATGVRLLDLARFAMTDAEAMLANGALAILHGDPAGAVHVSPLAAGIDAILFMIFGANDASARVLSVVAGLMPVALCFRLRAALGRWGALIAALLFALSPTFLYQSRSANGEIVAIAGVFAALVGCWRYLRRGEASALYLAAAGLGVALAASEAGWMFLLVAGSFAAVIMVLRRTQQLDTSELDEAIASLRRSPAIGRQAVILFALVFIAGATAGLLNPTGLQSALSLAAAAVERWVAAPNQPASYFLDLLLEYELLPLAFGLAGMFYYLARGDRFAPFLAWWLGLSLTWYTLAPLKSGSALLFMLVPLILVAGRFSAELLKVLSRHFSLANEGVFILLGLLTCGIFGINLDGFAQTAQQTHLIVAAIAIVMLLLIGALVGGLAGLPVVEADRVERAKPANEAASASTSTVGAAVELTHQLVAAPAPAWRFNFRRAAAILGTVALVGLAVLFLHASFNLAFNTGDDPREPMADSPTTMEARELAPMLEELSSRWEGDPHSAAIAADAGIGPALAWYLRDFRSVSTFSDLPATLSAPIVIVAASGRQPALDNYAMHKMRWRWLKPEQPLDALSALRWQLYRGLHDVPASFDIMVYAQMR